MILPLSAKAGEDAPVLAPRCPRGHLRDRTCGTFHIVVLPDLDSLSPSLVDRTDKATITDPKSQRAKPCVQPSR